MSVAEPHAVEELRYLPMPWREYLLLPERPRTEWVNGVAIMTPPVSPRHGKSVLRLGAVLIRALPQLEIGTEIGLRLSTDRLRAPDVMVYQGPEQPLWVDQPPVLVVEVLSPSTRSEDTVRKSAEYATFGVGQYWIMDPDEPSLEVFENVEGGWERVLTLTSAEPIGTVTVGEHGDVEVDLREIART